MPSIARRTFLGGIATSGIAALAGCGDTTAIPPDQAWSQFDFDAANTAFNPDARGPTEEPNVSWVHVAGTYYLNSTQVLVGDDVYANAGYDGVYALDPVDGAVRWHDPTDYKELTPALADGLVLPGSYGFRSVATDGGLTAFGHRFGYRNWQSEIQAYPVSAPTVADNTLVAGVGTTGHSPGGGRVSAFAGDDGTVRWNVPVDSTVWGTPAVADGVVYAAQRDTQNPSVEATFYALSLDDGERLWARSLGPSPRFDPVDAPVAGEGLVYLSTGTGPLIAVDAASGERVWTLDPPGGVQASPALADGTLYVGDLDGTFHAVDAQTGETRWSASVEKWYGGPTVGADGVYAVTAGGTLVAWTHDGREQWHMSLDPLVKGSPVVADGRIYIGTTDGLLYALS